MPEGEKAGVDLTTSPVRKGGQRVAPEVPESAYTYVSSEPKNTAPKGPTAGDDTTT